MALLNSKKTRPQRAPTIASSSLSGRLRETLRNRNVLPRLLLCLCAVVGMLFAVEGWRASFPYRLGGRATHGIAAQVAFDRVNEFETERLRRQRAEQMPYLFEYDPEPLRSLPAKLRSNLGDMDEAETFEALSLETRNAFGLGTSVLEGGNSTLTPDNMDQQFATLKAALSAGGGSSGKRIDEIVDDFKQFLRAVEPYGIVSSDELEANAIAADRTIAIVSPGGGEPRTAIAGKAQLTELLKDTGLLGKWWGDYPRLVEIRPMLQQWLIAQSPVTLHYLATKTQASQDDAMASVDAVKVSYHRGEVLVKPGQVIDEELLSILQEEYNAIEDSIPLKQRLVRVGTVSLMFTVLAVLYGYYLVRNEQQLVNSAARLAIYLGVVVLAVALGRALSFESWRAEVIPLLATTMVFAIAYDQVFATLTAFMLALIITISTVAELGQFVVLMSVATTAVIPLRRVPSRSTLIKVGFLTGAVYFVVSWGTGIIRSQSPSEIWTNTALLWSSLQGAFCCLVAGYLVAGSLPFIESAFGVVTDISLLEMGDISHPLLHELVHRAPGTYNHSITVAAIGEAAADSIGANGLLVRVGAYFHDIGKMLKPQYFVENVTEGSESRHEHLAPAMSTLIIIGHVKDGVDLGRQHSLPQRLIDFIEQHHGTTLVEYFYHEATKQADRQPDHKTDAEESSFRYPGPKPQSRETGVLMLADAVESASRTLSEPTPKRIERLVHDLTLKRLLDGQFDECSLTLSEIRTIEESLVKSLIGIYHGRIKYPEQRTA